MNTAKKLKYIAIEIFELISLVLVFAGVLRHEIAIVQLVASDGNGGAAAVRVNYTVPTREIFVNAFISYALKQLCDDIRTGNLGVR